MKKMDVSSCLKHDVMYQSRRPSASAAVVVVVVVVARTETENRNRRSLEPPGL